MEKNTPRMDDARKASLTTAKNRKDAVLPIDNAFSVSNSAALDVHQPLFVARRNNVSKAEEATHKIVKIFA